MSGAPPFRTFTHRGAVFRLCTRHYGAVVHELVRQRRLLETYVRAHRAFKEAMEPVPARGEAPESARRMAEAAARVGVGPMAAVAGVMAQLAVEAALAAGDTHAVVDNGGDVFLAAATPVVIGLDAGEGNPVNALGLRVEPGDTPLAVCSSSGRMGHSLSLGRCDLATVTAADGALADAAATLAANLVKVEADIDGALERVAALPGIGGVLIVKGERVGMAGRLPPLVRAPT
jgi:ApbE superfamily uncharacterized protein (UPF0280 family)